MTLIGKTKMSDIKSAKRHFTNPRLQLWTRLQSLLSGLKPWVPTQSTLNCRNNWERQASLSRVWSRRRGFVKGLKFGDWKSLRTHLLFDNFDVGCWEESPLLSPLQLPFPPISISLLQDLYMITLAKRHLTVFLRSEVKLCYRYFTFYFLCQPRVWKWT